MTFPIYRKLSNEKSYYKIVSAESFIELQRIGSKTKKHTLNAMQYPEKLLIQDMIALSNGYLESKEEEFDRIEQLLEN
jgi:hypothetical protein